MLDGKVDMFSSRDRQKCEILYERYYAGRKFHDSLYRDLIGKHLRPGQHLLDAGCGRYLKFCKQWSDIAEVVGIDLETTLETNNQRRPFAVRGDVGRLPFPDQYFDLVISRSVVEHLDNPPQVFREFFRVLRPGGKVIVITPNKYDYVSLIAALTPYRFHRALVSRIFQIAEGDIFPTRYRANTIRAIRKAFRAAGLVENQMTMINHYPAYLMFSPVLFRLGVLYERLTSMEILRSLRGSILCVFEKPQTCSTTASPNNALTEVSECENAFLG
jgi:ubiquinone/menaquinone biosynthesis C-methylase UbiE